MSEIRKTMRNLLAVEPEQFLDCGEVNCTKLAEVACDTLDDYEPLKNGVCACPEEYFEIAFEEGERYEKAAEGR